MSEFDELQAVIRRHADARQAEQRACEAFLNALYHALRTASGPGLPLNNVTLEFRPDPDLRLRPAPTGSAHAAWLRLGLCEVLVRVRRSDGAFVGDYGSGGTFRLDSTTEDDLLALARTLLRHVTGVYGGVTTTPPHLN